MTTPSLSRAIQHVLDLPDLHPSDETNVAFRQLVAVVTRARPEETTGIQPATASQLRSLCGQAEYFMEVHAAQQIIAHPNPHHGLREFVYASNYHDLARREVAIMRSHAAVELKTSACIGSGPLPLTSVHYALHGIEVTHNVDSDPVAASTGSALLAALGTRGAYIVDDASTVTLAPSVDAVLLAALVGSNTAEKLRIIKNLAQYIVDGGILAVRSASGPRALLYPPFEWAAIAMELKALKLELVGHYEPHDAVINSLVVFRKSGA